MNINRLRELTFRAIATCALFSSWSLQSCDQRATDSTTKINELKFKYEILADSLMIPWNIQIGPDGFLWATEQVRKVIRISTDGQQILPVPLQEFHRDSFYAFGMAFHPDFLENGLLYMSIMYPPHTSAAYTGYLDVVIAQYNPSLSSITLTSVIIDSLHTDQMGNPGGRMIITADDKLLVVSSCEADFEGALDTNLLEGKMLRFNLDGSIPKDNPFPNSPVYSIGHRNPQGLILMEDGTIYSSEHGPSTDDEFNRIEKGRNYGWPLVRGVSDSAAEKRISDSLQVKESLFCWTPTIAPSSLCYYGHSKLHSLENRFLVSSLKENDIRVLSLKDDDNVMEDHVIFDGEFGRIRDMEVDTAGNLYLSTANILPFSRTVYDHIPKDTSLVYDVIVKVYQED